MRIFLAAFSLIALLGATSPAGSTTGTPSHDERIVLSGGCFWGVQAVYDALRGVKQTTAGYSGGAAATAHYDRVSTGTTGHAESVEVTYDPAIVSAETLLRVFFTVAHDPTELNRQGPDVGSQYRSVIFFTTPAQEKAAREMIAALAARHVFPSPIVTQVVPLVHFYPAENYHQHYARLHPDQPYIAINDLPKVAQLRRLYPNLATAQ